jgi:hypothetical protein
MQHVALIDFAHRGSDSQATVPGVRAPFADVGVLSSIPTTSPTEPVAPPMNDIPKIVFTRTRLDAAGSTTRALEDSDRRFLLDDCYMTRDEK